MRNLLFLLALIPVISCGPIEVEPIEVQHNVTFTDVQAYFTAKCEEELGETATQEEINDCVNTNVLEFIQITQVNL